MEDFNLHDKVVDMNGQWEGHIDAITPQGKIGVKTSKGHEWVFPFQIKHKDKSGSVTEKKSNISFF